jgi:hypothetical protein
MQITALRTQLKKLLKINEYHPKRAYLLIPGMVSRSERKNLAKQASRLTGRGHVLEFGAFFGASTAAILCGLKQNGLTKEFHVFDYFKTRQLAKGHESLLSFDGEWLDFSGVYDYFINDPVVHTHKILIRDLKWKNEPIEFIHLDLPKDWSQAKKIANDTFPWIIKDAKLIFQDYVNQWSFEIGAMIGFLLKERLISVDGSFGSTLSTSANEKFGMDSLQSLITEMSDKTKVLNNFDYAFEHTRNFLNQEEQTILRVGRAVLISENDKVQGLKELSRAVDHMPSTNGRGSKALKNALEFGLQAKKSISE